MEGFENFIGLNPWTALFMLCNLVIVFLVFRKFLFKPVNKMIDDRQQEIDGLYADAEAKRAEAERLHAEYETQLAGAKAESQQLLREANSSARQQREDMLRETRQEIAALKEKAGADIALEKKKARNEVKDELSGLAIDIAEKVVGKELNAQDQTALVEEFIRQMGDET